jgi:FkbM family methyltransferase
VWAGEPASFPYTVDCVGPTPFDTHLVDDRLRLFDVGARGGIDPRWRDFHPYLDVIGFEPDPDECNRLNREAGSLPYPARFLPHALAREAKHGVSFYLANWDSASSIYRPNPEFLDPFHNAPRLGVREQRQISTVTLDQVCAEEAVQPDCLKLDVEGAELDVLLGGETALSHTLILELEVEFGPMRVDQPLFAEIDSYLREREWSLFGLRRSSWRRGAGLDPSVRGYGGQLVQGDALYYNGRLLDGDLPVTRGVKLLVILAAYAQVDFVLELLRTPSSVARQLSPNQRSRLEALLVPRSGPMRRLLGRGLRRFEAKGRRSLADFLQPGDANIWQDPNFF